MALAYPDPQLDGASLTARLSQWTAEVESAAIAEDVRAVARHCLLDWIGVILGGLDDESAAHVRAEVLEHGGDPVATLVGTAHRSSVLNAALANGTAGHALDFDDVHPWLTGHPTVVVMSAIAALAEREGATGRQLIDAFVIGVEVACRVGLYVGPSHYARGWHATATAGSIGAAAGLARLLGLDGDATARAIGLAASQAGGLKSMFGTMCKPLHAGKAASNALTAALLARRGFTARTDALECEQGFNAAFGGDGLAHEALEGLGAPRAVRSILFKYHAACFGTHAGMEALLRLRETEGVGADDIDRVELFVPRANMKMCNIAEPTTGLEAKFSMRVTAAMALLGERTGDAETYDEALCARSDVIAMRDRVQVSAGASETGFATEAVVHLRNGVVHRSAADAGIPEPDLDRQAKRLREKFMLLASPVLGESRANALAQAVEVSDSDEPVRALMAQCAVD